MGTSCRHSSPPLANVRTDEFGGSLENRLRFPLEVFDAIREVWPREKPLTVRISATDWAEGGNTEDDALLISEAFALHGAAAIDVSTGQVTKAERPEYGRSYRLRLLTVSATRSQRSTVSASLPSVLFHRGMT